MNVLQTWVQILKPSITSCVTLGNFLNLSVSRLPFRSNKEATAPNFWVCGEDKNKVIYEKGLEQDRHIVSSEFKRC